MSIDIAQEVPNGAIRTLPVLEKLSSSRADLETSEENGSIEEAFQRHFNSVLDQSRAELVDLSLRNPLLNYKPANGSKNIELPNQVAREVLHQLLKDKIRLSFEAADTDLSQAKAEVDQKGRIASSKLQTPYTGKDLHLRLARIARESKRQLEEHGANLLYLAVGALCWNDPNHPGHTRRAPLLLVPVALERAGVRAGYQLLHSGAELEANLALLKLLQDQFLISLPECPGNGQAIDYLRQVAGVLRQQAKELTGPQGEPLNFRVERNSMTIGLFSCGRFRMYKDLDPSVWPTDRQLWQHQIVQGVLGGGFAGLVTSPSDQQQTSPLNSCQVLRADSSQQEVLSAASSGLPVLKVEGPPGTGKSNTVINMVTQAIADGKKVLFLSEKKAAREIIKRGLDNLSLGAICLELDSTTTRTAVYEDLRRTVAQLAPLPVERRAVEKIFQENAALLDQHAGRVGKFVGQSGYTVYDCLSHLVTLKAQKGLDFQTESLSVINQMRQWNKNDFENALGLARRLDQMLKELGEPENHPFYGAKKVDLKHQDLTRLCTVANQASLSGKELQRELELLSLELGNGPAVTADTLVLLTALRQLTSHSETPEISRLASQQKEWHEYSVEITKMIGLGTRYSDLERQCSQVLSADAWERQTDISELRQTLARSGDSWLRWLKPSYHAAVKELRQVCRVDKCPGSNKDRLLLLDKLLEARQIRRTLNREEQLWQGLCGELWQGIKTDFGALDKALNALCLWYQDYRTQPWFSTATELLTQPERLKQIRERLNNIGNLWQQHDNAVRLLVDHLCLENSAAKSLLASPLADRLSRVEMWLQAPHRWLEYADYYATVSALKSIGLGDLLNCKGVDSNAKPGIAAALEQCWWQALANQALSSEPLLLQFGSERIEQARQLFQKAQRDLLKANAVALAGCQHRNMPRYTLGGQWAHLQAELCKKGNYRAIRQLLHSVPQAVLAAKPLIMATPEAVTRFLSPDFPPFDILVVDEGSQMRVSHCLGAIARSEQLVVMGDSCQLPPPSYWEKRIENDNDDDLPGPSQLESILDVLSAYAAPSRMLTWHYRSTRPELIALSNKEFYQGKLEVFPAPFREQTQKSFSFHYVQDEIYQRGTSRTNQIEAEAVVDAIIEHALVFPEKSLGVATMNEPQMEAVEAALEQRLRLLAADPLRVADAQQVERYLAKHIEEPFFVKNLENLQGDQRDVIIISIGYGRDADGKLPLIFGPLNQAQGERRLNTLITRAKEQCRIFSSILPHDLLLTENSARGVTFLKRVLEYAKDTSTAVELHRSENDMLAQHLGELLRERGYQIDLAIGEKAGVSLAVRDPKDPTKYLMGIITDGPAYQGIVDSSDRESNHEYVLRRLGWKVEYTYVAAWLRDPNRELKRLQQRLQELSIGQTDRDFVADGTLDAHFVIPRAAQGLPDSPLQSYRRARVVVSAKALAALGRADGNAKEVHALVRTILSAEAPIHLDNMCRRVATAGGFKGQHLRQANRALRAAVGEMIQSKEIIVRGEFLYLVDADPIVPRSRAKLATEERNLSLIPPEELLLAAKLIISQSCGIKRDELIEAVHTLLGATRSNLRTRAILEEQLASISSEEQWE